MRRATFIVLAAAFLGALTLLLAGCGSKSNSSASQTSSSTTTTSSSTSTTTTVPTLPRTTPAVNPTLGLFTSKNCRQFLNLAQAFGTAMTGAGQDVDKTAQAMRDFADKTPSEVREDFRVLADAYVKMAVAFNGLGTNPDQAEVMARISKLSGQIDSAKVSQASAHISAWAQKNCTGVR